MGMGNGWTLLVSYVSVTTVGQTSLKMYGRIGLDDRSVVLDNDKKDIIMGRDLQSVGL